MIELRKMRCRVCDGRASVKGEIISLRCPECGGHGYVYRVREDRPGNYEWRGWSPTCSVKDADLPRALEAHKA